MKKRFLSAVQTEDDRRIVEAIVSKIKAVYIYISFFLKLLIKTTKVLNGRKNSIPAV